MHLRPNFSNRAELSIRVPFYLRVDRKEGDELVVAEVLELGALVGLLRHTSCARRITSVDFFIELALLPEGAGGERESARAGQGDAGGRVRACLIFLGEMGLLARCWEVVQVAVGLVLLIKIMTKSTMNRT